MTKTQSILVKEDFRLRTKITYLESRAGDMRRIAATPMVDATGSPYSLLLNMSDWQIGELSSAIKDLDQARIKYDVFKNYVHSHLSNDAKKEYLERVINSRSVSINSSIGKPTANYISCDNENLRAENQISRYTMEVAGVDVPCDRRMTRSNYEDTYNTALNGILSKAAQEDLGYLPEKSENLDAVMPTLPSDAEAQINGVVVDACDYLEKTELSGQAPTYEEKQFAISEITRLLNAQNTTSSPVEESPMEQ